MSVDVSKLREGDVVLTRVTLLGNGLDSDGDLRGVNSEGAHRYVRPADIVSVEPRPLKVGDRVKHSTGGGVGEIKAIHEDYAWVLPEMPTLNVFVTKPLCDLSPA